jgi:hypothetical protein
MGTYYTLDSANRLFPCHVFSNLKRLSWPPSFIRCIPMVFSRSNYLYNPGLKWKMTVETAEASGRAGV